MSDFDKEAEREKLREKYAEEEEKREATEQMSELLLKGATMTNAHCGDCGDPIFRYDGQEFCPTCQKPVDRGTDEGDAADASADESDGSSGENIEVTSPSDDATVRFGGDDGPDADERGERTDEPSPAADARSVGRRDDPRDGDAGEAGDGAVAGGREMTAAGGTDDVRRVPSAAPSDRRAKGSSDEVQGPHASGDAGNGSAADHLASAQLILARTVERFARQAADANSPREAREHLEAAREAAETLDAAGF